MNKQNKRKLYTFRHMWIRQALKPANDTRDQALSYANNTKWNTNHNRLLTKNLGLYLIDQYNPLDLSFWYNQIKLRDKFLVFKNRALFSLY